MAQEHRIPSREPFHAPSHGSFTANKIRDGDRYELSEGHYIYCAPAGESHARHNVTGASLLDSDPDVEWSGVDAGFSPAPNTLCAPDVSVAPPPPRTKGWIAGVPPLAVEYAGEGKNEDDLKIKINELLAAGTRFVWVVRLIGPQRVEVYTKDARIRRYSTSDTLEAPGILRNPIPIQALFDRRAAHRATLRNLLQREGYEDLEAVLRAGIQKGKAEGRAQGLAEGILKTRIEALLGALAARAIKVDGEIHARIRGCRDSKQLDAWLMKAVVANRLLDIF
uniref:Endonuclease, Uma2 family (Restriction endonuclease fold) n=1 Tax=Candidatus Kentrum sp. TC TaxID=2126339 RepID=A0A450Z0A5_9GAMM|nr:MAG: Endonuclease, Uma2 family (restriction endonuclease fold) [Candidatus Kentron sp. TC]